MPLSTHSATFPTRSKIPSAFAGRVATGWGFSPAFSLVHARPAPTAAPSPPARQARSHSRSVGSR